MPFIAARERSSSTIASAGISHIVVCVHGPSKRSSNWPSTTRSSYSGRRKSASQAMKSGANIRSCPAKLLPASQISSFLVKRTVRA
jgi:hypothetical protein